MTQDDIRQEKVLKELEGKKRSEKGIFLDYVRSATAKKEILESDLPEDFDLDIEAIKAGAFFLTQAITPEEHLLSEELSSVVQEVIRKAETTDPRLSLIIHEIIDENSRSWKLLRELQETNPRYRRYRVPPVAIVAKALGRSQDFVYNQLQRLAQLFPKEYVEKRGNKYILLA